jgi:hypothetical protein
VEPSQQVLGFEQVLDFYRTPGMMTGAGRHTQALAALPRDLPSLARIVQGLVLHEFTASAMHGAAIAPERRFESHLRSVPRMLDRLQALDDRPLHEARPPSLRLVGVCHHFALLLAAMLRAQAIPVRARWGFGAWFNPPFFEDHVLCEVWQQQRQRWLLVDAQLDEVWQRQPTVDFDVLDVPRDRFITAADAWVSCREGRMEPGRFGIFEGNRRGLWFIAGCLIKDVVALVKDETLPWDVFGAMPAPGQAIDADQLRLFDQLAALTRSPDDSLQQLRRLAEADERVRVPEMVFNAMLGRTEPFPEPLSMPV